MKYPIPLQRMPCLLLPAAICAILLVWPVPHLLIARKVLALLVLPPGRENLP